FGLLQTDTENILERFAQRLGVDVQWSTEGVGFSQHSDGVSVTLRTPHGTAQERLDYLVGCDGARSAVRRCAGIAFDGSDGRTVTLVGDVELDGHQSSSRI